jgi:hypothetical protein
MPGGGAKPGERRGGRKAGTPNKVTNEVRELAQQHTEEALAVLVEIALSANAAPAARVSAASAILDRGHGRPPQAITGEGGGPIETVSRIVREFVDAPHPSR